MKKLSVAASGKTNNYNTDCNEHDAQKTRKKMMKTSWRLSSNGNNMKEKKSFVLKSSPPYRGEPVEKVLPTMFGNQLLPETEEPYEEKYDQHGVRIENQAIDF